VTTPDEVPASLRLPGLGPVWAAARRRVDRGGDISRSRIGCPELDPAAALALESLLGRPPGRRLDLGLLEGALADRSVGKDLSESLGRLGYPPSIEAARRRETRTRIDDVKAIIRTSLVTWPESWAPEWGTAVSRAGLLGDLTPAEARDLVGDVRRLLDRLPGIGPDGVARAELAAQVLGSAHALDRNRPHAAALLCALRLEFGPLCDRVLWARAGVTSDRVSAPVLTWGLDPIGQTRLDDLVRAALAAAVPIHLSAYALARGPLGVRSGSPMLVVENPRLVEAAAERRTPFPVITTNGNATRAVTTLIAQLVDGGADLRYHGDFDAPGIGFCRRMVGLGCRPWRMDAVHYRTAVEAAEAAGVRLPRESRRWGLTPWDPDLAPRLEQEKVIVHEEMVLDELLTDFPGDQRGPGVP